jgi:hypothetical protein
MTKLWILRPAFAVASALAAVSTLALTACSGPQTSPAASRQVRSTAAAATPAAAIRPRMIGWSSRVVVDRVPAKAIAPWLVQQRVDALRFGARTGLQTGAITSNEAKTRLTSWISNKPRSWAMPRTARMRSTPI